MVHKTTGRNRLAMWIAAILVSATPAASAQDDSVLEPALHYFTRHDAGDILALFDSVRPAPVSDAERGRSLAMLPTEGDLRDLDTAQRKKVAAVRRVLELHRREAVYVIKVIAVPQAAVALHDRAVVLVSERALDLLDADELQALVAHEVGHEYFWGEYFQGRRDNSQSSLRRLELLCDGFAVITLQRVGLNPKRLTAALEKIGRYNRDRFGVAVNENNYPALSERRRFVGRLVEWLGRSGAQ
jgi:Zn-dependent protease with chaperone function